MMAPGRRVVVLGILAGLLIPGATGRSADARGDTSSAPISRHTERFSALVLGPRWIALCACTFSTTPTASPGRATFSRRYKPRRVPPQWLRERTPSGARGRPGLFRVALRAQG